MDPEGLITLLVVLLVLLGIGSVIAAAIYVIMQLRAGESLNLSLRLLFRLYLYLALLASLLVVVSGLAHLGQAALSGPIGREFSYYPKYKLAPVRVVEPELARPADEEPTETSPTPEEQEEERHQSLERAFQEGLLQGASLTIVGGIIWGVHFIGRRRLEREEEGQEAPLLNRVYLLVLLLVFSIITITSLPGAVFETLRYYLLDTQETFRSQPGGKLATALVALPFWLFYLRSAFVDLRRTTT